LEPIKTLLVAGTLGATKAVNTLAPLDKTSGSRGKKGARREEEGQALGNMLREKE
jgi:hypothetical protein